LLAAVQNANPAGMSGTIVETAKLGLPSLPTGIDAGAGGANLTLQSLVSGSHTIRFWYAGETKQRVAMLGELSESDLVHNGTDLWTYTSTTRRVTHSTVQQPANVHDTAKAAVGATPQTVAERALALIDPTTTVAVDGTARVAGRAAYELVVSPKDARSLVASVRIAIDSETNVPLRVQVFAKSAAKPAVEIGFTDVSFKVPDASVFTFVPPAGTTVTEESLGSTMLGRGLDRYPGRERRYVGTPPPEQLQSDASGAQGTEAPQAPSGTKVLGTGWTAVAVVPTANLSGTGLLMDGVSAPVTGGRVITSVLVSVFLSDDGHAYIGAVPPADLQQVASTGRGL
jgi:outer membrane lipoprotein-sorting protein